MWYVVALAEVEVVWLSLLHWAMAHPEELTSFQLLTVLLL